MILSVDFGKKRTGTATLDRTVKIPFPHKLIEETNPRKVKRKLMDIIEESDIDTVVFGLPLSDEGKESLWCLEIRRFAQWLEKSINVNIIFVNEYATSKEADIILRGKKKSVKKSNRDLIAAVLILETFMYLEKLKEKEL